MNNHQNTHTSREDEAKAPARLELNEERLIQAESLEDKELSDELAEQADHLKEQADKSEAKEPFTGPVWQAIWQGEFNFSPLSKLATLLLLYYCYRLISAFVKGEVVDNKLLLGVLTLLLCFATLFLAVGIIRAELKVMKRKKQQK